MSYRCGVGAGMAKIGFAPRGPAIVCDGCGAEYKIDIGVIPPRWFLDGKPPRGWHWANINDSVGRRILCQKCWREPSPRRQREEVKE